jgi:hypothetical protein
MGAVSVAMPTHVPTAMAAVTAAVPSEVQRAAESEKRPPESEMAVVGMPTDMPPAVEDAPPAEVAAAVKANVAGPEPPDPVRGRRRSKPSAHPCRRRGHERSADQHRRRKQQGR